MLRLETSQTSMYIFESKCSYLCLQLTFLPLPMSNGSRPRGYIWKRDSSTVVFLRLHIVGLESCCGFLYPNIRNGSQREVIDPIFSVHASLISYTDPECSLSPLCLWRSKNVELFDEGFLLLLDNIVTLSESTLLSLQTFLVISEGDLWSLGKHFLRHPEYTTLSAWCRI